MSKYIDFEDPANRDTYVGRTADPDWVALFDDLVRPGGARVADIGCGGGIYTRAIAELGAGFVLGIDSAELSLTSAREYCAGVANVGFERTDAQCVGLADGSVDAVVERALIHHFGSVADNFAEVRRVLAPGGVLWLQDRTVQDVLLPPSDEHVRGYYLSFDASLRRTEVQRRRHTEDVTAALRTAGFGDVRSRKVRELRKVFHTPAELREEIVTRRGRSILHGLDDGALAELADHVLDRIGAWPVHERDTWTVWLAGE